MPEISLEVIPDNPLYGFLKEDELETIGKKLSHNSKIGILRSLSQLKDFFLKELSEKDISGKQNYLIILKEKTSKEIFSLIIDIIKYWNIAVFYKIKTGERFNILDNDNFKMIKAIML